MLSPYNREEEHQPEEECSAFITMNKADDGCSYQGDLNDAILHHHSPLKMLRNVCHIITLKMIPVPPRMNSDQMMKIS
jgi:hypothetical protein